MKDSPYKPYDVGQRIKTARKACGMTQLEAAEELNVSEPHYRSIENGSHEMSLRLAIRIAALYHMPIDYMLLGHDALPAPVALVIRLIVISANLLAPYIGM